MNQLIRGLQQFRDKVVGRQRAFYKSLAKGQAPETLFITCSDSRINPGLITQTKPGQLFVVRNAGCIVPAYGNGEGGEAASIEYAVNVLAVSDVVVCGHSHCGAMAAIASNADMSELPALRQWLAHAERTRRLVNQNHAHATEAERAMAAVSENVLEQLDNLRTHPSVAGAIAEGRLRLHGWIYTVDSGVVLAYDKEAKRFAPINASKSSALQDERSHASPPAPAN